MLTQASAMHSLARYVAHYFIARGLWKLAGVSGAFAAITIGALILLGLWFRHRA